ncbi:fimbrial protein [Pseudomonas parafulva]|uniref:fimbrial protein n=1 Tax=Pseudomonas parafulva TaxID=157782 RepID=UPI00356A4B84
MFVWSKIRMVFAALLVSLVFNSAANATCYDDITSLGPDIVVDLSEHLRKHTTRTWTTTVYTNFPNRPFYCNGDEDLKYQSPIPESGGLLVGFHDGAYWVRMEIVNKATSIKMKGGTHTGSAVNTAVALRFTLVDGPGPKEGKFPSSIASIQKFINVIDDTNMGFWESVWNLPSAIGGIFGGAPEWKRRMFTHNLVLIYTPTYTTCKLDNPGLTVTLPDVSISSVTAVPRAGYTPFNLNFSCANLHGNGVTDRAVDIFLSSNDLGTQDTYLIDQRPGAAQGVGIMLVTANDPSTPVIFSRSSIIRGRGTSIHSLSPGSYTPDRFTASMGAFYFPFAPNKVSIGPLKAAAIVNIIYP